MADQTSSGKYSGKYQLEVPLDASAIEGFKPDQAVKVLAQGAKGPLASALVTLDAKGHGVAKLGFDDAPGGIRVIVGPHNATDKELTGLQTIGVDLPARRWANEAVLRLPPIVIAPYYWWWWFRWCRSYTISGKVVCPDGHSPVVGATVCAFDVDWWWWYRSSQQIACGTTDINGAFTITFKWCCGWWPWWWWETRLWQIDPVLIERIVPVLQRNPDLHILSPRTAKPSLVDFRKVLGAGAAHLGSETVVSPAALTRLREPLLAKLPLEPEFERLRIWPWYPWYPWNDCAPDVIFKVTQNCSPTGIPNVIVDETVWQTRWDIPTTLNNVVLVANDKACCLPPPQNCLDGECLGLTLACDRAVNTIGGNIGVPPIPVVPPELIGLYDPNGADQPFGGAVSISGTVECTGDVDYYEFEWLNRVDWLAWVADPSLPWKEMPPTANGAFTRQYIRFSPLAFPLVPFSTRPLSGRNVYESLQHYQQSHPGEGWDTNSLWISNRDQMINWLTQNFPDGDGIYYLRVKGYVETSPDVLDLTNPRILDLCDSSDQNHIVLRIDNQISTSGSTDVHGQPCTAVHACTQEPDTMIGKITILNGSQYQNVDKEVEACGIYNVKWPDKVRIDFIVYDPDGFLANYHLNTYFGVNQARDLLGPAVPYALSAATLPFPGSAGVPAAHQPGPDYAAALAAPMTPATRPVWQGGLISIVLPATDDPANPTVQQGAFPTSCCYQLRLDAWKRTIVNCNDTFRNTSETSFTINVVP